MRLRRLFHVITIILFFTGLFFGFALHIWEWIEPSTFEVQNRSFTEIVLQHFFEVTQVNRESAIILAVERLFFIVPALIISTKIMSNHLKKGGLYQLLRYPTRLHWYIERCLSIILGLFFFFEAHFIMLGLLTSIKSHKAVTTQDVWMLLAIVLSLACIFSIFVILMNVLAFKMHDLAAIIVVLLFIFLLVQLRIDRLYRGESANTMIKFIDTLNPFSFFGNDVRSSVASLPKSLLFLVITSSLGYQVLRSSDLTL